MQLTLQKDNNLEVTIDQADKTVYNYNYNWWWHHNWMWQQQMMWQQQQMQQQMMRIQNNLPNGFGPNPDYYDNLAFLYSRKEIPEPITFIIDKNGKILPDAKSATVFVNIDKDENLKPLEENKNIKNVTATFNNSEMRYIYEDKKSKKIIIKSKPII